MDIRSRLDGAQRLDCQALANHVQKPISTLTMSTDTVGSLIDGASKLAERLATLSQRVAGQAAPRESFGDAASKAEDIPPLLETLDHRLWVLGRALDRIADEATRLETAIG